MLWSSSIILNLATTWWPLDVPLNEAMKLRHLQSFPSLFAWARKSCANDRKAKKILACNEGEKKRPPPHIHIKWQRFRHYGCIVYSTLLSFSSRGTNKQMEEIFLNTKNIFSEGKLSQFVLYFISNYLYHTRQTLISTMMRRGIFCVMMKWRRWWKYDLGSFKWVNKGNCGKTFLHQSQTGTNEHWEEKYWAWGWLLGNLQNTT